MEVIISDNADLCSKSAAAVIAKLVREKPNAVLGLATGSTPLAMYKELIRLHKEEGLDFSKVTTFNLDEYISLPADHPQSYNFFMHEHLFKHINVKKENINIPDGMAQNIKKFCEDYESKIKAAGGIDLQVLGIGSDGHIGFNEQASSFASRTRIKALTRHTLDDNSRFFGPDETMPTHSITMGIATIMDARTCLLLAFGGKKAKPVADMVEGPVSAMCPASILQHHPRAKIFIDEDAAKNLTLKDYFKWCYSKKF